ncbi:SNARE domain containing protein [Babesia divergens]|uniref:SNARE domain containing protein n=1 Tax=Babesia divergens TaxID=32595 RepID=A0AAD9LEK3_BABDI|nr:SNARE domain containing protein [Babesia divergens]
MYTRTHQLQSIAEGIQVPNKYVKDCIIVVDNDDIATALTPRGDDEEGEDGFSPDFRKFMKDVTKVRELISRIDGGVKAINDLLDVSASAVTNEQNANVSAKLNKQIAETNEVCTQCMASTSAIEKEKDKGTPTEARMRTNAYNVCLKHFQAAMKRYQDAQIDFKKAIKERTARQIQLIYPDVEQADLDRMVTPGNTHSVLEYAARSSILGNSSLTDAVNNIQSKYNDVLALEESVEELHQMMVELAGVASYQGDLIDQVEHNAMKAVEYTQKTTQELIKAQRNKRRSSKMIMYITIAVTVTGVVVMVPFVVKLV